MKLLNVLTGQFAKKEEIPILVAPDDVLTDIICLDEDHIEDDCVHSLQCEESGLVRFMDNTQLDVTLSDMPKHLDSNTLAELYLEDPSINEYLQQKRQEALLAGRKTYCVLRMMLYGTISGENFDEKFGTLAVKQGFASNFEAKKEGVILWI